ncbi:MAG: phospholipase, partial [Pseudomonadota bacterium]
MPHAPLDGPRHEASSGTTKSLVILTHGYGASGHDLIELGKQLAPAFPNTTFVAPNAPEPCAIAPEGYQWFPLSPNPPGSFRPPEEYYGGVESAAPVFNDFLDR